MYVKFVYLISGIRTLTLALFAVGGLQKDAYAVPKRGRELRKLSLSLTNVGQVIR